GGGGVAAGEAKLPHAVRNEGAAQPVEFFERQQVGLGQECHVLRHAIDAAKIATIGHRDAQISDRASERVDQRGTRVLAIECEILRVARHHGALLSARASAPASRRSRATEKGGLSAVSYGNSDGYRPERPAPWRGSQRR